MHFIRMSVIIATGSTYANVSQNSTSLVVSWRLRHIQLVERIIGIAWALAEVRIVSLKLTLERHFPELWEARLLPSEVWLRSLRSRY